MTFFAVSLWQPIASMVAMPPFTAIGSKNSGMAVISFDFEPTFYLPQAQPVLGTESGDNVQF